MLTLASSIAGPAAGVVALVAPDVLSGVARTAPLVAATILLFLIFRRWSGSPAQAALLTFVAVELVSVLAIESLSVFHAYGGWPLAALWGAIALGALLRVRRMPPAPPTPPDPPQSGDRLETVVLWTGAALLFATLVTALLGAPNTWDALTYHLPRAMHWLQNGSIAHYPTPMSRQLYMPPMAEILIAQAMALSGGDRLVNLVQWIAFGVTATGVFSVVRAAGLTRLAALNAALMFLALPMAVLQASGPKNDLVLCANLAAAAVFFQRGFSALDWRWVLAGATAAALSVLTKGTGLLFAGVLVAVFVVAVTWRHGARNGLRVGVLALVALVTVNVNHWMRNLGENGSALGISKSWHSYRYENSRLDFGVLVSNLLRNAAIEVETPSESLNGTIEAAVARVHTALGLRMDDPATTWPDTELQLKRFPSRHEDWSGNPLQFLAILLAVLGAPFALRGAGHRRTAWLILAFLLFSTVGFSLMLRWQPWHTRLHLPLLVAGSLLVPMVAWRRQRVLSLCLLLVAATSLPPLLANRARPLIGSDSVLTQSRWESQLFWHRDGARRLENRLRKLGVERLGMLVLSNEPEYLIWYVAKRVSKDIELYYVTADPADRPELATPPPVDAIVDYGEPARERELWTGGRRFVRDQLRGSFVLWRPRPVRRESKAVATTTTGAPDDD